jgi:membrane fusion protein (multidrug efflux system)
MPTSRIDSRPCKGYTSAFMAGRVLSWLIIAVVVGSLLAVFLWRSQQEKKTVVATRLPSVKVQRPSVRDLPIRLTYPAELQAIQAADIRPIEAKGYVRKLTVDKGSKVKTGQLLALVDCPEYHARRKQASEAIRAAKSVYTNAKLTLSRIAPMREKNFVSQIDVDNAQAAYDSAEARLKNEEARLVEVEHLLGYCEIRAPFNGEVTMRYVDPGEQVRPGGPPLLSLVRRDAMRVQVNVVERDAVNMREGLPVELTVHGLTGESFHGKVTRLVRSLDPRTRTLLTEIEIPNPDGVLTPGMFGRVSVVVDRRKRAILVPATAVLATDTGTSVFVIREERVTRIPKKGAFGLDIESTVREGRAVRAPVEIGFDTGEEVEILKGLRASDSVVVMGRDLIKDGALVRVAD